MKYPKPGLRCRMMAVIVFGVAHAALAQETNSPPAADAVPPPSAAPKLSAADLDSLVAPIALYPDSLVATILTAAVYPLEIVQAARFVADTNNLAKLDEQPWDDNVKALARVPDALKKLNDDLPWTIKLGEAFLAQDKDVMDTIQRLRLKAEKNGMLRTTEQQIVVVTNTVSETTIQQQVVIVTNTIVQIVPSNPEVVYVPQYNPIYAYSPPPTYVYDPYAPVVTFAAGVAVGMWISSSCDWHHGGCYYGGGDYNGGHNTKIKVEGDVNIGSGNRNNIGSGNRGDRVNPRGSDRGQKWQPNQSRLNQSGAASGTSARSQEARGWGSSARPSTGAVGNRPSTGNVGARPSTGSVGARPATGTAGARPSTGAGASANRPSTGAGPDVVRGSGSSSPSANRPSSTGGGARPTASQSSVSRPSPSTSGRNNAFSGVGSGASARQSSSRGSMSRSSGGMSRGGGGRGGGRGR